MFTPNSLIFRYFTGFLALLVAYAMPVAAQENIAYGTYYNAELGFKPAQEDFPKIFLQLAGSLEYHCTPEPYIRHVMAEHARIAGKFEAATGNEGTSRPKYLTDAYVENLISSWNKLAPGLKLDGLCRDSGRNIRYCLMGTWNMSVNEKAALETKLTPDEAEAYRHLIAKPYFTKADFPAMEKFYETSHDKLTIVGRNQLSKRVHRGTQEPEAREKSITNDKGGSLAVKILTDHQTALMRYLTTDSKEVVNSDSLENSLAVRLRLSEEVANVDDLDEYERDAFMYSHLIKLGFTQRFEHLRRNSKTPEGAKMNEEAVYSMVENLVVIAHSEFMAALRERELKSN